MHMYEYVFHLHNQTVVDVYVNAIELQFMFCRQNAYAIHHMNEVDNFFRNINIVEK